MLYIGLVAGAVVLLCLIIWLVTKKKHIIFSSLAGLLVLVLINQTASITGINFGYNLLSVGVSVILGLPGVALLLFGNLL